MSAPARTGPLQPAIAIIGATGTGKSDFAMTLARSLPVEIVSVDSAQVYRGLDIGTAKPSRADREVVPHHLLDIREPEQVYSAGEFRNDCLRLLPQIIARGRVPLLVGGTMLYYRALFRGIAELPAADPTVRAAIDARARLQGWPALHAELAGRDPQAAAAIAPNDAQRIQRALEVLEVSGRSLRAHWAQSEPLSPACDWRICILDPVSRVELHARLAARLDAMLRQGFVDEVRGLLARGTLTDQSPVLRLVGYRQFVDFCRGRESFGSSRERALAATRQLAKRQLTWLRSAGLFPPDVEPKKIDAFDPAARERLTLDLIEQGLPP